MRMLLGGLTAFLALLFAAGAPAAAAPVECPLTQARREVTNTPSGWFTTPVLGNLTNTRVATVGGRPTLICEYGGAGSIQREAPARQTCRARPRGFECEGGIVPTPLPRPVVSSGDVSLRGNQGADLDTGRVASGGDLYLRAVTPLLLLLEPSGGARMQIGDRTDRDCAGAHYSADHVRLENLSVGQYLCVRTNEGRIAQVRVTSVTRAPARTLGLHYVTRR